MSCVEGLCVCCWHVSCARLCPIDLKEPITSLIFAAPRCADLPELLQLHSLFSAKYGKEFVTAAAELRPDCGVNRQVLLASLFNPQLIIALCFCHQWVCIFAWLFNDSRLGCMFRTYQALILAEAWEILPLLDHGWQIIEKLSVTTPSGVLKLKLLKEIATEHNVEWDSTSAEADLLKVPQDLLVRTQVNPLCGKPSASGFGSLYCWEDLWLQCFTQMHF